jgi:hypothetical protein
VRQNNQPERDALLARLHGILWTVATAHDWPRDSCRACGRGDAPKAWLVPDAAPAATVTDYRNRLVRNEPHPAASEAYRCLTI